MLLVVDSGSTKSDWVLLTGQEQHSFSTMGLNPYFHDAATVFDAVSNNDALFSFASEVTELFFYGAGCSAPILNEKIANGLQRAFPSATIHVDHDLKACALATYNGLPAISCIIGTGSNSCYFDGNDIYEEIPALGYILGDEGSGSYFGKKLLSNFLYKRLPASLSKDMTEVLGLTKDVIIDNVYMQPNANVYLASFMRFIAANAENPYIKEMIFEGFKQFIDIHVCCYPNYRSVPTHFVGSIAYLFKAELEKAAEALQVQIGQIVQKPIDGLVKYHAPQLVKAQ